jgi:(2Fe-2S) ferredoxin
MVIYPEGVWYRVRTREEVDAVLEAHLVRGGRVSALMLTERDVVEKAPKPAVAAAAGGDG